MNDPRHLPGLVRPGPFKYMDRYGETLYRRLGVSHDAPREVIDAAYKALLKLSHPDLAVDDLDRAAREELSRALGEAHATLADPSARALYDAKLNAEEVEPEVAIHPVVDHPRPEPALSSPTYRPYDDLSLRERHRLRVLARHDSEWAGVRRQLLAARDRIGRVPAAWLGLSGAATVVPPARTGRPLQGAIVAAFLSGSLVLVSYRSGVTGRLVERFDLFGLALGPVHPTLPASLMFLAGWVIVHIAFWAVRFKAFAARKGGSRRLLACLLGSGVLVALLPAVLTLSLTGGSIAMALWALSFLVRR